MYKYDCQFFLFNFKFMGMKGPHLGPPKYLIREKQAEIVPRKSETNHCTKCQKGGKGKKDPLQG